MIISYFRKEKIMKKNEVKQTPWLERIKYIFLWSSAYFTVITLLLLISQVFQTSTYVAPAKFLMIYPFAIVMALGNLIIKAHAMKIGTKTLIHCLMTISGLYIFLILPNKSTTNAPVILLIFSVIYFLIATPILIVRHIKLKKAQEETPYKPMFSKQK